MSEEGSEGGLVISDLVRASKNRSTPALNVPTETAVKSLMCPYMIIFDQTRRSRPLKEHTGLGPKLKQENNEPLLKQTRIKRSITMLDQASIYLTKVGRANNTRPC